MDRGKTIRVLVLGGGFGGVYSTLHLERIFRRERRVEITLVSNENFFLFTPFLHEVATGGIETRHIANPIRRLRGRKRFEFLQGEVQSIDLLSRKVMVDSRVLDYDYLVLALGGITDISELPSWEENVFTLKTLWDGMLLRNHLIRLLELADGERETERQRQRLTFVVSGGGYTGVQMVAEMRDFIYRFLLKSYHHISTDVVRVILVQDEQRILLGMDEKLASIAYRVLQQKGIEVKLSSRVTRVHRGGIEINGTELVPTETLVWVAGIKTSPVVAALTVEKDDKDRVMVSETMEVPGFPGVYALGDNAHFRSPATGEAVAQKAHNAVRQAKVVAANIAADLKGKPKKPYHYSFMGEMVSLGSHAAVAKLYGWRISGFLVRIVWIIAYLAIMLGQYNRIRVALDWLLALFFGRDITLLRIK